jgi:hypothetical protein
MQRLRNAQALLRVKANTLNGRQFDVGLISPFGPRFARPKRRKIVPRTERFFAPVEFTLNGGATCEILTLGS